MLQQGNCNNNAVAQIPHLQDLLITQPATRHPVLATTSAAHLRQQVAVLQAQCNLKLTAGPLPSDALELLHCRHPSQLLAAPPPLIITLMHHPQPITRLLQTQLISRQTRDLDPAAQL
jgi:hypothetical protein